MIASRVTFDSKDIKSSFSETILQRGRQYVNAGKVLEARYSADGELAGKVRGTRSKPYEVEITLVPRQRYIKLESSCTCPYGGQCKHGAALAMYALSRGIEPEDDLAEEAADFSAFESALQKLKPSPVSVEIKPTPEIRQWFGQIQNAVADEHATDPAAKQRVYYRLQLEPIGGAQVPTVAAITRNILKSGALGATHDINPSTIGSSSPPKHWTAYDARLLSDLERLCPKPTSYKPVYRLDGPYGESILRKMLASGRCVWGEACLLELGQPAPARFKWQIAPKTGIATPVFDVGRGRLVLGLATPWYIEHATGKCGPVETELPARLAAALLRTSPILPEFIGAVRAEFESLGLPESVLPQESRQIIIRAPQPVPTLSVDFESCVSKVPIWTPAAQVTAPVAFAKLSFEYEGIKAPADGEDLRVASGNDLLILRRNRVAERYAQEILLAAGWQTTAYCGWEIPKGRTNSLCIVPPDNTRLIDPIRVVSEFSTHAAPKLVEAGWKIEIDQNIRYVPESQVEWDISLDDESGVDWFEFRLGIRVEGEAFDLRSILAQVFKADTQSRLNAGGARHAKSDDVFIFGLNGRAIKLSRQRLQAIIKPLTEIFGGIAEWPDDLRLSKSRLPELATLEESTRAANVPWKTSAELQRLRKQFAEFSQLEPMPEPEGFNGTLRTYQREGLAWLQFLRENGFGGVLADDMGLGKTVQVLAHIQTEKVSGRMDRPCLIVAPTSTMPNWRREAERFAPHLRVVTLQGTDRAGRFGAVKSADIVLTTYPLLARDKASLLKSPYHLVVLDEAQNVKNPATAAAKAVRELSARHRLCLSGTPVENHLGELWSLFHFLMPGFLGSETEFSKGFRTPIEKSGNGEVRERLARRVRPFMLRRTKGQVVKELPAKTEIIECVEFGDPQRDLYESIRVVMDEKVRELLASQGFNKSRIQILDALLKLRQVCCDPRLVKLPSAKSVADSAKLERLMEMLRILVEDGRRVLLFSQFTSMLDLIEARLREAGITWVRISGDTVDRDTPVRRFQAGEVPLFLISLKAGGTGLNLTAADTVILYDPWWNPAVENQAIDRAHRIGQEKPVMVYKLVASGTIEEKMLEIQDRKADIARSILSDDADGIQALTAEDLRWVFAKA